jgi:hypothetical protein
MNIKDILSRYDQTPSDDAQRLSIAALHERSRAKSRVQRKEQRAHALAELHAQDSRDVRTVLEQSRTQSIDAMLKMPQVKGYERGGTLLVQLSDLHFGAVTRRESKPHYCLKTASKRLRLYAQKVIEMALIKDTRKLVIALTGDMVESRMGKMMPDKMVGYEGSQMYAAAVGAHLVGMFINEIRSSKLFDEVRIHGCPGNESRLTKDISFEDSLVSENLDCRLHEHLHNIFHGLPGVELLFKDRAMMIEIEELRVLLIHGHTLRGALSQKQIGETLAQYGADYGMSGHIHYPYSCADWARSGSLVGEDNYAADGLTLRGGNASQTVIHFQGTRKEPTFMDLDDPGEIEGYEIPTFSGAYGVMEFQPIQTLTAA